MTAKKVAIIRENDDQLAKARISLGATRDGLGFYIVFRGDPEDIVQLMKEALEVAKVALPAEEYEDHRERSRE